MYFVTDVAHHGDLLVALSRLGSFDVPVAQFYAAEIVVALEFVHRYGVVHRDVKPENVLIRKSGHIMLTDFGSAQIYDQNLFVHYEEEDDPPSQVRQLWRDQRYIEAAASGSMSSSTESDEQMGGECDYWALGATVFQMISGQAPFRAVNDFHLMNKIQKLDFSFPAGFPDVPKDFVSKLLVLDPMVRLGSRDLAALKSHEFFNGVDWENIVNATPPDILPAVSPGLEEAELKSIDNMPEPGLDEKALTRLMNLSLMEMGPCKQLSLDSEILNNAVDIPSKQLSLDSEILNNAVDIPSDMIELPKVDKRALTARQRKLEKQRKENPYHLFVQDNLIIRSGFIDKKKGLFSRRRMFLLTEVLPFFAVALQGPKTDICAEICPNVDIWAGNFSIFSLLK
ncbi:hypothetical protein COOONC_11509 [Cooperia oncophora]